MDFGHVLPLLVSDTVDMTDLKPKKNKKKTKKKKREGNLKIFTFGQPLTVYLA